MKIIKISVDPADIQTAKTTPIRGIAVLETSVSRHHGDPIEDSLKFHVATSQHYRIEERFKWGS